jgi:hypothetical protein
MSDRGHVTVLRRAGRGGAPLRDAIVRNAERHAEDLRVVVEDVRASDAAGLRAMGRRDEPPRH